MFRCIIDHTGRYVPLRSVTFRYVSLRFVFFVFVFVVLDSFRFGFVSFRCLSFRFVVSRFVVFRYVAFRFVAFRILSFLGCPLRSSRSSPLLVFLLGCLGSLPVAVCSLPWPSASGRSPNCASLDLPKMRLYPNLSNLGRRIQKTHMRPIYYTFCFEAGSSGVAGNNVPK